MRDPASLPQPPALQELLDTAATALFLDFDGTLVELAPTPDGIAVPVGLAERLAWLADRLEGRIALVSGRGLADIEHHLGPLTIARAGSHGSDCRMADGAVLGQAPAALNADVFGEIAGFAQARGLSLEEKPHGAALHYRHDPALEAAALAFADDLAARAALALKRGKCVVEFVAPGADKGTAVTAFMQEPPFAGARPVFIGDDVTDEDGFGAVRQLGGFGIIVGDRPETSPEARPETGAQYRLHGPAAVNQWLGF